MIVDHARGFLLLMCGFVLPGTIVITSCSNHEEDGEIVLYLRSIGMSPDESSDLAALLSSTRERLSVAHDAERNEIWADLLTDIQPLTLGLIEHLSRIEPPDEVAAEHRLVVTALRHFHATTVAGAGELRGSRSWDEGRIFIRNRLVPAFVQLDFACQAMQAVVHKAGLSGGFSCFGLPSSLETLA